MIIAVDFDGTIVIHDFPRVGEIVPGAVEWLKRLQEAGAQLILYTMRDDELFDKYRFHAVQFCEEQGICFWGVNQNPEQHTWTRSPKVYAHLYIDDAALGCPLVYPYHDNYCQRSQTLINPVVCTCSVRNIRPYVDWSIAGPMALDILERYHQNGGNGDVIF